MTSNLLWMVPGAAFMGFAVWKFLSGLTTIEPSDKADDNDWG